MNAPAQTAPATPIPPTQSAPVQAPTQASATKGKRRTLLLIIATVVILTVFACYGVWWTLFANHFENTDDAYVAGNVVQLTSQVAGTVLAISADDTELVTAGKPLIELDKSDAQVALDQAEAQLAQTVREVRTLFVNNGTFNATVATRSTEVERTKADLARREELAGTGAISKEELAHARDAVKAAESALQASREQLASSRVMTDHTSVDQHPNVLRAASRVREAFLALSRTSVPAPIGGYVAKRSVQVGQRIAAGAPLLSIVPLDALWVDANFKESQLAHMRSNQPVTLHSDLFGSDIVYHGKVMGMSAGTGSAFALLPAQNASGNWIKVVQRIPVRIALDPQELASHPLRIGLSMQVKVDVAKDDGNALSAPAAQRQTPAYATNVFASVTEAADARVAKIIAANGAAGNATHHL